MAATTITRDTWTDDNGSGNGTKTLERLVNTRLRRLEQRTKAA
jgi:hypothetical protein